MSFSLEPPKTMPPQQAQRIKDLKCPQPLEPSVQTARLKEQQKQFLKITDGIDLIEKQVDDLEKRFKISFSCKSQPQFNLAVGERPYIDISGAINNIELNLHLWGARMGNKGGPGDQGDQGPTGASADIGETGLPGYYGIRGDTKK